MRPFLICLLTAALCWPGLAQAQVVGLSVPDTTATKGAVLWLPVRADADLTGRNVTSFELQFSIYGGVIQPDSIDLAGTLLDGLGWTIYLSRPSADVVRIAAAGVTPLSGSGTLLLVRVPLLVSGWTPFSFTGSGATILNEGDPPVAFDDGSIQVNNPSTLDVHPDGEILAVGDQRQFTTWGGTPPVTWSTNNSAVASIDADGLLTALSPGSVRVMAVDAEGIEGTSDGFFVVRALGIQVPDTAVAAGRIVDVPVSVTLLTPWNVTAGSIRLTFNADVLTPIEVLTAGCLLEGKGPVVNLVQRGQVAVSFASDQPLTGQGPLFSIRFQTVATPTWSDLVFTEALFNEDLPARFDNGYVSVLQPTTISIDDGGAKVLVGDTLVLQAWGGDGAYVWSCSDTTVARVDALGRVIGLKSGVVRVTVRDGADGYGLTPEIRVFDGAVQMPQVLAAAGGWVDLPVRLPRLSAGHLVSSYQLVIAVDPNVLTFVSASKAGTATESWATSHHVDGHRLTVAGATAGALAGPGTLCVVRYAVQPTAQLRWESQVELEHVLLNEGSPVADRWNGRVTIAEPPGAVVLWSPGDGSIDQPLELELSWGTVEFGERYELQVATDTTFANVVLADTGMTLNSIAIGPLESSTMYAWRVRASNVLGVGPWSEVRRFTTVLTPPPAPILALPASGSLDLPVTPTLVWRLAELAATYTVQISEDSTFEFDVRTVGEIGDTLHVVSALDHDRRFFWRVRGVNTAGWGAWSDVWWFTTVGTPAGIPELVAPPNGATGVSVTPLLTWRTAPNANLYHVQVTEDSTFASVLTEGDGISDTTWVANGLTYPRLYFWRVRTYGPTDTSIFSGVWRFTTTGPDGIVRPTGEVPNDFGLDPNFPNPFNPSTRITFHVKETSPVTLTIFTLTGSEVERLVGTTLSPGTYDTQWDGSRMPSGIYVCRMTAGSFTAVRRLVLVK